MSAVDQLAEMAERIAELEAQVARLAGMPPAESHSVTLPREEDADLRPLVGDPPALRQLDAPDDSALLDALEKLMRESAGRAEALTLDGRVRGTVYVEWWRLFPSGEACVDRAGPDLRAAIRAALEASTHE